MRTRFHSFRSREIQKFTPQALLNYVKEKGSFPKFIYNKAEDKMLAQLDLLAQRYRQSLSIEDKAELLKHEREMLYEEVQKPELTLARYYPEITRMKFSKQHKKNIEAYLTLFNLNGISRINSLDKPFEPELVEDEEEIIKSVSKKVNNTSPINDRLETYFKKFLECYSSVLRDTKYLGNTKENILSLKENINQPELLKELLTKAKLDHNEKDEIKYLINNILNSENSDPEIFRYAVWGAGKYRSKEAFSKIKEIALDKNEKDIRKREFAIHSVARYLREKTDDVHSIIENIENEDSIFAPLARIINDKINGRYYSQEDRELKYYGFNSKMKKHFKDIRDKFYKLEEKPSIKNKNALDRNLIPFYHLIDNLVNYGFRYYIQKDTYTKINTAGAGVRDFTQGPLNSGSYNDTYDGISNFAQKYNMMNLRRIEDWTQNNVIAHENGHTYHHLMEDDYQTYILDLYKMALKENRTLDYYAAANEREYIAQGFEAFTSIYKPHTVLLDNHPSTNTRYKLIAQDPLLYSFILKSISFK